MFHRIYKLQFISKISRAYLTFCSMMLKSMSFPLTVPNCTSNGGIDFSLQSLLTLLNCDAASLTVFTTIFLEEQQTSDNLIVKDYCFIIKTFDKFSFACILRGCLSHLNESWKE